MNVTPTIDNERIAAALERSGFAVGSPMPRVVWFGNTPELAGELGALVRDGVKQASAGLLWLWEVEGEALPHVGETQIIVDWVGHPLAVIEITKVVVRAFGEVDEAFAREEGEGDGTLKWWREAHTQYFGDECAVLGKVLTQETPVVCWSFRLVHAVGRL